MLNNEARETIGEKCVLVCVGLVAYEFGGFYALIAGRSE